jgi:endonuclease/exonuclease/phosphatase family metal-dependent hydrolase
MPDFEKPEFHYDYNLDDELGKIKKHQTHRGIPEKSDHILLLATWNIANLGTQKRRDKDLRLIAEIIRPFDLIAIQEVKDDYRQFHKVVEYLGNPFQCIFTDRAGNDERLAFIYDKERVQPRELVGELVILPRERPKLTFNTKRGKIKEKFQGFNRNPFLASWQAGKFTFTLVNVHIYYGAGSGKKFRRRVLEVYALARWAHKRVTERREFTYDPDIILIGDFNVPKLDHKDRVLKRLKQFGMAVADYSTRMGTNLEGVNHYDQIAFLPSETAENYKAQVGVFDFDKVLFSDLWKQTQPPNPKRTEADFRSYVRYYISDHRLLWASFDTTKDND